MNERKCTFTYSVEEQGNWINKTGTGVTRSEAFQKTHRDGSTSMMLLVEDETGQLREVFANTVKFTK